MKLDRPYSCASVDLDIHSDAKGAEKSERKNNLNTRLIWHCAQHLFLKCQLQKHAGAPIRGQMNQFLKNMKKSKCDVTIGITWEL